jgi:hypothetical protein
MRHLVFENELAPDRGASTENLMLARAFPCSASESSAGLMGSERVRRHPHRRN